MTEGKMKEITPISPAERVLGIMQTKMKTGVSLTSSDELQAMTATATELRGRYGPLPSDTKAPEVRLPETVKGAIANAKT